MLNDVLNILFPKRCINCHKEGSYLCDDCLSLIDVNPFYYCLCNKPSKLAAIGKCKACEGNHLNGLLSSASFDQGIVKNIIHKMKHNYIKELSLPMSVLILTHLSLLEKDFSSFSLVPVPLSIKKMKRRGFNQSEEIGRLVSDALRIPFLSNALIKITETKPQSDLDYSERLENVKNCFEINNKELISSRDILLLDDIYSTGSTMSECAKILKNSGANKVVGISVAREINTI